MGKKSIDTQNKIAGTARELFIEKGFDGVKMQELADRAGVNKGLLHHYFNNKQTLFNEVFNQAIGQLFSKIESSLQGGGSLEDKLNSIIDAYLDMLLSNPKLPVFVFFELNKNPEHLQNLINEERISIVVKGLKKNSELIDEKKAIHILLTIVSLSVFPFMAKPVVLMMVKGEENFSLLIEERRPIIKLIISNLVKSL